MKRLGSAMAGAAVVATALAALTGCGGEQAPPPRPSPSTGATERPVVLVHGLGGDPSDLAALVERLRAAGRRTVVVALPLRGVVPIAESTSALESALDTAPGPPSGQVDLVGYSLGGVVVRSWLKEYDAADRVAHVVTIAAPHHGTLIAGQVDTDRCLGACLELRPDSRFLRDLNDGDETPEGPQWVTLRTSLDRTVAPIDSASLEGALNVLVQDVCPDSRASHASISRDPLVVGLVVRALDGRLTTTPSPSDCEAIRDEGLPTG